MALKAYGCAETADRSGLVGMKYDVLELFGSDPRAVPDDQLEYDIYHTKNLAGENVYIPEPLSDGGIGAPKLG